MIASNPLGHYSEQHTHYSNQYYLQLQNCFLFEIAGVGRIQFPSGYNITIDGVVYASSHSEDMRKPSVRFGNCGPTTAPTQFPSLPPSTLAPTYTPYEEGSITAMVSIFTDAYPHETSWTMIDVESEAILLSESSYDYAETEYKHHVCLLPETCAVFIIVDSCGDGVHAPGGYRLSVDNKIVVDTYGSGSFLTEMRTLYDLAMTVHQHQGQQYLPQSIVMINLVVRELSMVSAVKIL